MRLRVDVLLGLLVAGALVGASPVEAQYFRFGKNKVQYDESRWYYVQSTHFDVYYREGNHYLADFTAKASEEAYERLSSLFQYEITDRIPILVYDSHRGFAVTNAVDLPINAEGIGGVTELFKNRVALPFNGDYRSYRQTLHHELVHALMNDMFYGGSIQSIIQNQIQLRIPHWFNEGLAEYASEGWSTDADTWMRDATIHDNLPPIAFLGGFASYQAGQSVWDYVAAQYGEEKIGEILQRLRLTRSVDAAFKRATGLSLDELSERWHKTLKEVHYPEITAREALTDIARPVITRETGGFYNTSPALSPQGDRLAYITTHNGLFDVYVASALDGSEARKVVEGQTSRTFESLRILSPGLSWSPDGTQLAIAVTSGDTEALAVVDVRSGRTTSYPLPQVDQLLSVDWHPSAPQVALSASTDAQSDLYVLDLTTQATTRLTNDLFSDHEPAWSPDGRALVFHSDRGAHTHVSAHPAAAATDAERFEMVAHGYEDTDIYHLTLGQSEAQRLTSTPGWDNRSPQFSADGHHVLFTSDRNGIFNLYSQALHPIANDAVEHPLTNLVVGLSQWDLSADGRRAALVSLNEGTPVIYVLRDPLNRPVDHAPLTPTVWAQRVTPTLTAPAPALALAPPSLLQRNPFLRDATDGRGYFEGPPDATGPLLAALDVPPLDASTSSRIIRSADLRTGGDSTSLEQLRIDFRNYAFGEAFDEAARAERDPLFTDRFSPVDHVDEQGTHTPKRYKLNFSPDIVYGTAGYDMLYGAQGVTQMMFSDMLGNHQIFVSTNLLIDLRNSDYVVSYSYLPRRLDWTISTYHISRLLPDYNQLTYFRFRRFGVGLALSYPLDKFRRVDLDLSMVGVSQANVGDPSRAPSTRRLVLPTLVYTKDVTQPGLITPSGGHRYALSVSGAPTDLAGRRVGFVTTMLDARSYVGFGRGLYSLAFRASGGTSWGPGQQLFYSGGVQNWINRDFDNRNGFPVSEIDDFLFATPVLPLRGSEINTRNGSHFGLLNAEFRFPLVAALLPGPLPLFPLYNLQGTAFLDAGALWGGRGDDMRLNVFRTDEQGDRVLDDLLIGSGVGLRTIVFGFPARLDFSWPFDGRRFGERQVYLSIGVDF